MAITVSLINMKGGVGKTTITFNFSWYSAWEAGLKVLVIDLDPQANLSQYFMGAKGYLKFLEQNKGTVVEIFEQFSAPNKTKGSPALVSPDTVIHRLKSWKDGSLLDIIPSRLELAWTLKNPTEKAQLLPQFLSKISDRYNLIIIDCAPTESILTTAAYRSSRFIVVPVKPEFLATVGLPLLARSIEEHKIKYQDQELEMAGIVFNGGRRNPSPEQRNSYQDVTSLAKDYKWNIFEHKAYYSDSYPAGSRASTPIFLTNKAREYVRGDFKKVGVDFLTSIGLL